MDRPVLHVIVGKRIGEDYVVKVGDPLTLETAVHYAEAGWDVIQDPEDQAALARYEQLTRQSWWRDRRRR
jgi:hypothetical protein